jgi:putative Holliday junction resolvase
MVSPNDAKISHYLGVDFGKAHIGLAIAESESKIAFRYGALPNGNNLLEKLVEIVRKEEISTVVIGMPGLKNQGDMGDERIYREFRKELLKMLSGISIEFQDEMFTTKMAKDNLLERGGNKISDHEEAARIILQSWLEARNVKRGT